MPTKNKKVYTRLQRVKNSFERKLEHYLATKIDLELDECPSRNIKEAK